MPFFHKIGEQFENITDINFIKMGDEKVMLANVDHKKLILFDQTDGKFQLIDQFMHKNKKS